MGQLCPGGCLVDRSGDVGYRLSMPMRLPLTARTCVCAILGATFLATGSVTACAERGAHERIDLVTRDSSGIEIAELQADPWSAPVWAALDTVGVLRIVPDETRPETLFGRVRGTLRLSDGSIAVLDIARYKVLVFG